MCYWCLVAQVMSDPLDSSPPASLAIRFPKQEHWSWLPFSPPGDLPDPGTEPVSTAWQADSLTLRCLLLGRDTQSHLLIST